MAVAKVFVLKGHVFSEPKKQGDATASESLAQEAGGLIEAANGVLQLTLADGGGSYDERAILDSLSNGLEFFGPGKQRCSANRRTRLAESQFIRIYHAEMEKSRNYSWRGAAAPMLRGLRGATKNDAQEVGFCVG